MTLSKQEIEDLAAEILNAIERHILEMKSQGYKCSGHCADVKSILEDRIFHALDPANYPQNKYN